MRASAVMSTQKILQPILLYIYLAIKIVARLIALRTTQVGNKNVSTDGLNVLKMKSHILYVKNCYTYTGCTAVSENLI